jgi:hypothetical protein
MRHLTGHDQYTFVVIVWLAPAVPLAAEGRAPWKRPA